MDLGISYRTKHFIISLYEYNKKKREKQKTQPERLTFLISTEDRIKPLARLPENLTNVVLWIFRGSGERIVPPVFKGGGSAPARKTKAS